MKKLLIVANWKSNMNIQQTIHWLIEISNFQFPISNSQKEIIVCPPFTSLFLMSTTVKEKKISMRIGAQNISAFEPGSYTGEVNGEQIRELADYVLVGHSERRQNFGETDKIVFQKIELALKFNLKPIVCLSELSQVQSLNSERVKDKIIVAYEPLFAIGTGITDSPENADEMAGRIKNLLGKISVIYGGSVTSENVASFTSKPNLDGVLVGKASLEAKEFQTIIQNA